MVLFILPVEQTGEVVNALEFGPREPWLSLSRVIVA